jgi:hypothetical protein
VSQSERSERSERSQEGFVSSEQSGPSAFDEDDFMPTWRGGIRTGKEEGGKRQKQYHYATSPAPLGFELPSTGNPVARNVFTLFR